MPTIRIPFSIQSHSHFQDHIFNIPGNCTVQYINQYWYNTFIMSRLLCELTQSLLFAIATLSDTGSHSRFDLIQSFAPTHYVYILYHMLYREQLFIRGIQTHNFSCTCSRQSKSRSRKPLMLNNNQSFN